MPFLSGALIGEQHHRAGGGRRWCSDGGGRSCAAAGATRQRGGYLKRTSGTSVSVCACIGGDGRCPGAREVARPLTTNYPMTRPRSKVPALSHLPFTGPFLFFGDIWSLRGAVTESLARYHPTTRTSVESRRLLPFFAVDCRGMVRRPRLQLACGVGKRPCSRTLRPRGTVQAAIWR